EWAHRTPTEALENFGLIVSGRAEEVSLAEHRPGVEEPTWLQRNVGSRPRDPEAERVATIEHGSRHYRRPDDPGTPARPRPDGDRPGDGTARRPDADEQATTRRPQPPTRPAPDPRPAVADTASPGSPTADTASPGTPSADIPSAGTVAPGPPASEAVPADTAS